MNLVILGATGSIGRSALEVVEKNRDKFRITAVSANRNIDLLLDIAKRFNVPKVIITDPKFPGLKKIEKSEKPQILVGIETAAEICGESDVDIVLNAVVGSAGYLPTKKALLSGKTVALANKETMVAYGEVINRILAGGKGRIVPVDSEHSAVFQLLENKKKEELEKIILTASGGPLRNHKDPANATVEEVLRHPTWNMGPKITVDSASLANKGLEVIEAARLFNVDSSKIDVVVHPSSVIHSLVELKDGSIIAQLAHPDMKLPIQYALNYPERQNRQIKRLSLGDVSPLEFFKPDKEKFPLLSHAYEALDTGGTMPAVFNAVNEVAVSLFLEKKIKFGDINTLVRRILDIHKADSAEENAIIEADRWAREKVLVFSEMK